MSNYVFPSSLPGVNISMTRSAETDVKIQRAVSGKEYRSTWWASPLPRYTLNFEFVRSAAAYAELQSLASFWARHFGALDSFLITDPEDNAVTSMGFGVGDAVKTAFQLQRTLGGVVYDKLGGPWVAPSCVRVNQIWDAPHDMSLWPWVSNVTRVSSASMAPDGTFTASRLIETTTPNQDHGVIHWRATDYFYPQYTVSAFVRRVPGVPARNVYFRFNGATAITDTVFDLDAATATLPGGNQIPGGSGCLAIGGGWFRIWSSYTAPLNYSGYWGIFLASGVSDLPYTGTNGALDIWGTQWEPYYTGRPSALLTNGGVISSPSYWPAIADGFEPVNDPVTPTVYQCDDGLGLRACASWARTNTCLWSQQLEMWTAAGATITANAATAPDGSVTADKLAETAGGTGHSVYRTDVGPTVAGTTYTFSLYAKAAERTQINFAIYGTGFGSNVVQAILDLSTGSLINPTGSYVGMGVVLCGNGWLRLWFAVTATAAGGVGFEIDGAVSNSNSYAGVPGSGVYLWGAQAEANATTPYDYITTTTTPVTRTDYTLSSTGLVTFTNPPRGGAQLLWSGSYYKRVRFDGDLSMDRIVSQIWNAKKIDLIGVKP
jgi:hypothetical protein